MGVYGTIIWGLVIFTAIMFFGALFCEWVDRVKARRAG